MDLNWCCAGFEGHLYTRGGRGFAIHVQPYKSVDSDFILQFRSVNPGDEHELADVRVPVTLLGEVGFQYCPWCGRNVREWYRGSLQALYIICGSP